MLDDEAKEAAHILCSFYGVEEEEQLLRKVYKCPVKSAKVMLEIFKEKGVHLISAGENICYTTSFNSHSGVFILKAETGQVQIEESLWTGKTV